MQLKTIAINNLIRRKAKTAFVVIGLIVGITASITLLSITQAMKDDIQNKMEKFGANIIIAPRNNELPLNYGSVTLPGLKVKETNKIRNSDLRTLEELKKKGRLKLLSPKLISPGNIFKKNVALVGVRFEIEKQLKSWWKIKGGLPQENKGLIAGSTLSSKFNLKIGQKIFINNSPFIVRGILKETGTSDDNVIFAKLEGIQQLLEKPGKISLIEASAPNGNNNVEATARNINEAMPQLKASGVTEALKSKQQNLVMFTWFSIISSAIILFVASLIVFITTMSSVNERTREIGIFRAVGFRKKHVFSIIMIEALVVSLASGFAGSFIGYLLAVISLPMIAKGISKVPFNPLLVALAIIVSVIVGLAASLLPAKRAANLDPAEALRFI